MVGKIADKDTFHQKLAEAGDKAVIIDFTASWCGPCRTIGPKFEAISQEYTTIVVYKVDVDENSETAEEQKISAMPTFKVYKNGKQVDELVGASEAKLKELFEKYK